MTNSSSSSSSSSSSRILLTIQINNITNELIFQQSTNKNRERKTNKPICIAVGATPEGLMFETKMFLHHKYVRKAITFGNTIAYAHYLLAYAVHFVPSPLRLFVNEIQIQKHSLKLKLRSFYVVNMFNI